MTKAWRNPKYYIDKKTLQKLYWEEQLSMQQIAERYGLTKQRISQKMQCYSIPARRQGRPSTPLPSPADLQKLLDSDIPITNIARQYNISYKVLVRRLHQMKLTWRNRRRKINSEDLPEIKRLYWKEEMSTYSIGLLYNVSAQTIYRVLTKDGSSIRSQSEANKLKGKKLRRKYTNVNWPETD